MGEELGCRSNRQPVKGCDANSAPCGFQKNLKLNCEKGIDNVSRYTYNCIKLQREVIEIAEKSRADYFKERRKNTKAFYVEIEKDKMERFEVKISNEGLTKKDWLNEKIDEELKK